MNFKKILIIVVIVVIAMGLFFTFHQYKNNKRVDAKVPVLLYHDFVKIVPCEDPDNFNYINTPESFEENIKTILENGYTIISMQELNDAYNLKTELPSKPIIITFDDGYYSNYEYIYPILKKYNVKVSIFIVTDKVGKKIDGKKYLGWNECLEMQNSGLVEIFSHSKRHVFYDKLGARVIRDDVKESYQEIEKNLGKQNLKVFAYPYGAYTKEAVWALKQNGIDMQVYDIGMNYFNKLNKDYIKRINIPCEMTGKEIVEEITKTN
ncbi:MAG: polysaccharide deacetylase family protein [Clostridia bacterium]|nr:polysaccharide deacetylase family protein [Clostridia bacterium]